MSKHGIVGRVTQLARANVAAIIDSAEDPPRMIDTFVRDYTVHIAEADQAIAQLLGNLRIAEDDQDEDAKAAARWSKHAEAASQLADELRAAGESVPAETFDNLAMVALERQLFAERDVETVEHTIAAQVESIDKLEDGVDRMKIRLAELARKQATLSAPRSHDQSAAAQEKPQPAELIARADIMDPGSEIEQFEQRLRRAEARVRGAKDLRASPLDAQFDCLEDRNNSAEITERLKALKAGRAMASAKAKAQGLARDQPFR